MRIPVQGSNLLQGAEVWARVPMTIQAKGHAQGLHLADLIHFVDVAVAVDTTNTTIDMHRMVEIDEVRQAMNVDPRDGLPGLGAFPD